MKPNPIPVIAFMLLCTTYLAAQEDTRYEIQLKSGVIRPEKNITASRIEDLNRTAYRAAGKSYAIIQFETIPTPEQRDQLQRAGIELLDYVPNNAYTCTITGSLNTNLLSNLKARAVVDLTAKQKMQPDLAKGKFPAWATKIGGTLDVWASFPKSYSFETVSQELRNRNFEITSDLFGDYHIVTLRIAPRRLDELASLPFIEYVEPAPHEPQRLNNTTTANSRAHVLNSALPGQRNLRGEGVVVGIGDDSDPLRHIDFTNRIINRAATFGGTHGVHVEGIVGGGGINFELLAGAAPKVTIVAQVNSGILLNSPAYVQDFGMVVTNNSYGNVINDCETFGTYTLYSRILDLQSISMPQLQHVFAVGNSSVFNCAPYPNGFATVLGDFQSSKNTINVGNTSNLGVIDFFSSKGPAKDGRIKPEITAHGNLIASTWPVNTYNFDSGTSMSAPALTGGLALLIQRYRQLHGNANPKSALMKAILCNGATDLGNVGPDYSYGFGWLNLFRSVKLLENNSYINDSVANAATKTYPLVVPANTAKLKVMLYWNDPAASILATHTLVNDLDLEVVNPASQTLLPYILDTIPSQVTNAATNGVDHINNIEQVVVDNPAAGTYTLRVKGTAVTQNPLQEFFLVYDTLPVSLQIVNPIGGERYNTGLFTIIGWEAFGNTSQTFKVEYTIDGTNWNTINANVAANLRQLQWTIPAAITDLARVKITQNGSGIVTISEPFSILDIPTPVLATVQCEGYFALKWNKITGITDYEVMMLKGDEMVPIGNTTDTNYVISGLSKDTLYWVSVRARLNGTPGRRGAALSRQPSTGTCAGTISDNDIKVDAIIAPANSGRRFTSTELSNAAQLTIRAKNLDDAATTQNITFSYSVNNGTVFTETVTNPAIAAGGTLNHTFATQADLSAPGAYSIMAAVSQTGDAVPANDTLRKIFKQLDNPPITGLTTPFLDDIESATVQSVLIRQMGLEGLDRYDFVNSTVNGRLRTFVNSGIAYSGSKAITLDADRFVAGNTDSLTGTFNLGTYNVASDDIRFDFRYKNHGQVSNAANRVWVRGNDQQSWIEVYNLFANQPNANGTYKLVPGIEITDSLLAHSQNFSSSFQVRWGQWGQILAADNFNANGYSFDDIRFYSVTNDIQMLSIDSPIVASCALTSATHVFVTVRNSANSTISGVPVVLKVDGTIVATETLPPILANTTIQYEFNPGTADLSALGTHTIQAWVDLVSDSYRLNDTATITIVNSPKINVTGASPYLQDFESTDGSWYTGGDNSSWEYGTPSSVKIKRAASGSKAWKTRSTGSYNDLEFSYLYSPCFNITGMTIPTLSLSIALDLEDCGAGIFCDGAYIEYSTNGVTWQRLGAVGQGTNWYNRNYPPFQVWSIQDYDRWHVATIPLPTSGLSQFRLRFVMSSDPSVTHDGIAVDDIHIYDNTMGIYTGATMGSPVTANIPGGTGWVDFTTGGKLIASVNSPTENMGSTAAQAYINVGAVRTNHNQYYHNRNITIKPTNTALTDSALVRFYFLDTETETLINATGCGSCSKPSMAYELGVSKYNNSNDAIEDGSLLNNAGFGWLFTEPENVTKVPFDKGYYAEFKVKSFSEFWLNNGGFTNDQTLPVQLVNFTARKTNDGNVNTEWITASELGVDRYEIEVARGNAGYQRNQFNKIGQVSSYGNSNQQQSYQFTDEEPGKSGVRFYRLKIINQDGSFQYSSVRPVEFNEEITWQLYPNPSNGLFNLVYQAGDGELLTVNIYGLGGKRVKQYHLQANGFVQKLPVDLQGAGFPSGLYVLEANQGEKKRMFKLIKQ